jgi:hypothetical protein
MQLTIAALLTGVVGLAAAQSDQQLLLTNGNRLRSPKMRSSLRKCRNHFHGM